MIRTLPASGTTDAVFNMLTFPAQESFLGGSSQDVTLCANKARVPTDHCLSSLPVTSLHE